MARRLTVLGTGYLGATHAACLASLGFEVLGLDSDPGVIGALAAGDLPFYDPGLGELLERGLRSGGSASPRRTPRPRTSGTFTSSAWARRSSRTRLVPTFPS